MKLSNETMNNAGRHTPSNAESPLPSWERDRVREVYLAEPVPLTPTLSPDGGEGADRAGHPLLNIGCSALQRNVTNVTPKQAKTGNPSRKRTLQSRILPSNNKYIDTRRYRSDATGERESEVRLEVANW